MKRYTILRHAGTGQAGQRGVDAGMLSGGGGELTLTVENIPEKAIAELEADPQVKSISPVMPTRLIEPLNARDGGGASNWGIAAVGADKSLYTGAGVSVAVLDTGIDRLHEAFAGVELIEKDFTGSGNGDPQGHGTHCAGTVFGRDVAGYRFGVAQGVKRAFIGKVIGNDGAGQSDAIFEGLLWAMHERADIISMSLGLDFPGMVSRLVSDGWPMELATSTALEHYRGNLRMFDAIMSVLKSQSAFGVAPLVVAAAGNESRRAENADFRIAASLPAAADDVISVAAVGQDRSNYVVANFSNSLASLAAPGVDIPSARPGGGLRTMSGTSMACPHVAGVAALWWEALRRSGTRPNAKSVTARLLGTARKDVFPSFDEADLGQGFVTAPLELL